MSRMFISYSTRDGSDIAGALVTALETAGQQCWIAPRDMKAGADYPAQIVRAIRDSSGLVVLLTPFANESKDVLQEVQRAHDEDKPIFPLIVRGTKPADSLSYFLNVRQHTPWTDAKTAGAALRRAMETGKTSAPAALNPAQRERFAEAPRFPNPAPSHGPVPVSPQRLAAAGENAAAEAQRRARLRTQEIERAEARKAEEERDRRAREVADTSDGQGSGQDRSGWLQRRPLWLIGIAAAVLLYLCVSYLSSQGNPAVSSHVRIAPGSSGTPRSDAPDAGATVSEVPAASRILPSAKADLVPADDSASSSVPADFGQAQTQDPQSHIAPSEPINKIKN